MKIRHVITATVLTPAAASEMAAREAPAPLYRDPVTDGAADPCLVFNREAGESLYADSPDLRSWHGTDYGRLVTLARNQPDDINLPTKIQ